MTTFSKEKCEDLARTLKSLGWAPVTGKVMSCEGTVGYTIGVLVKVGDERLKWMEPEGKHPESETAQSALLNFFASAHMVAKNRPMHTQPEGFTSTMAGTDVVRISVGPNESATEFENKIRKISTVQVQIALLSAEDSSPVAQKMNRAESAVAMIKNLAPITTLAASGKPQQADLFGEPERPTSSMRP